MARWFCRFTWCPRNDVLNAANADKPLAPYVVVTRTGQVLCANPICHAPIVLPSTVDPDQLPQPGGV